MNYQPAINQYNVGASATTAALQVHLLAAVWPGAAPQVNIVVDGTIAAGGVRPDYDSATNTITIRHNAAGPEDILDNLLFEVNNALNPKVAAAAALSKATPVGDLGNQKIIAEYDTFKLYVRDLATIFAPGGNANNFPALVGGAHALPAQALATINNWIATYAPIYAAYGAGAPFAVHPTANLMPLPAVPAAPAGPFGAGGAAVAAEQAAILQFGTTIHNPGAAGEQFYLGLLTSKQVYGYELVRNWNVSQLTTYVKAIDPAYVNVMAANQMKPIKLAWEDERRFRPYLFEQAMALLPVLAPAGALGQNHQFDPGMVQVALEEASRAVSDRWEKGDLSKVKPVVPWLQPGQALRVQVDLLRMNAAPALPAINLSRIR
ncbi:hypothetical protein [Catellatospora tritici]|uniref:hypothetical protein n=1 Tax=Catellatospora tritici TaxID=2851566 RepID=UPI001C2D4993|nr:hypothetical protein [Catellatospora tritici]MBV1850696.1 hypothetical protein [Catellatospora tritici]MBV1850949.1 hypothetical protein [Catellatospora tritici]